MKLQYKLNTSSISYTLHTVAYRVYVVALVEVESPLHADTLTALQLPEHQLTGMALHCTAHIQYEQLLACL